MPHNYFLLLVEFSKMLVPSTIFFGGIAYGLHWLFEWDWPFYGAAFFILVGGFIVSKDKARELEDVADINGFKIAIEEFRRKDV